MEEGRETTAVLDDRLDERLRSGIEALVELAEANPPEARAALWALRGNPEALQRLERALGLGSGRATLALGGAIQLASAELSESQPDLRSRVPELLRWLEGTW